MQSLKGLLYLNDYAKTLNKTNMTGKITFSMIKPDAVQDNQIGAIFEKIENGGFVIKACKMVKMTKEQAGKFYAVHEGKPFYEDLTNYMSSGPIVAFVVEKENAVQAYRDFIGATNPEDAREGSIRKIYGKSIQKNAVHGSDSDENALIESHFFFSDIEIM